MPSPLQTAGLLVFGAAAAGVAALFVLPVVAPEAAKNIRPFVKSGVKTAVRAAADLRRRFAEFQEEWEDLAAEVDHELATAAAAAAPAAAAPVVEAETPERPRPAPKRKRTRKAANA